MRAIVIAAMLLSLQAKPDYSGVWVLNPKKSATAISQGLSPANGRKTIVVTEREVTLSSQITRANPNEAAWETKKVCSFGPTPSENKFSNGTFLCTAKWDAGVLVTTETKSETRGRPSPTTRSQDSVTTYTVTGTELKAVTIGTFPGGMKVPPITIIYDKGK